jgi:hypothetical protein
LQKFDVSNVLAVGLNKEIGQLSHPHLYHLKNEIKATEYAINKASGELEKLKQEQLWRIKKFGNRNELQKQYNGTVERRNRYGIMKKKKKREL